jgi:hypothetical protein
MHAIHVLYIPTSLQMYFFSSRGERGTRHAEEKDIYKSYWRKLERKSAL